MGRECFADLQYMETSESSFSKHIFLQFDWRGEKICQASKKPMQMTKKTKTTK